VATLVRVYRLAKGGGTESEHSGSWTESYVVRFTDASATRAEVLAADDGTTAVPAINDEFGATGLFAKSIDPRQDEQSPNLWTVDVTYELPAQAEPRNVGDEIWNIDVQVTDAIYSEVAYKDRLGVAIQNTARQPYQQMPTRDYYDKAYSITFRTVTPNAVDTAFDAVRGKVCDASVSATVNGLAIAGAARCLKVVHASLSTAGRDRDGELVWDCQVNIIKRTDEFNTTIANVGFCYRDGDDKLQHFVDPVTRTPINTPEALNASGTAASLVGTLFDEWEIDFQASFAGLVALIQD
jgi:hypothetical protein